MVITHEMRVIETICNKVAIIDHSNIVEEGEVKAIPLKSDVDLKVGNAKQFKAEVEAIKAKTNVTLVGILAADL